jgi:hypothetical protein
MRGTISAADLDLMLVTYSLSDALQHIERYAVQQFGLTRRRLRPSPLLGERDLHLAARISDAPSRHEDRCA